MKRLSKLQDIDRRWLYAAIFIACSIPFIVDIKLPVAESRETKQFYNAIENTPKDKVVVIDSSWEAGSQGENKGQVEVIFEHLFRKRIPFVVISLDITPLGPQFADQTIKEVLEKLQNEDRQTGQTRFSNIRYGIDYVNLGFARGNWQAMQQFCKNIRSLYKTDSRGYVLDDAENLPLMQRVRDYNDIWLIHSVTYSPQEDWIPFAQAVYGTKITFGCAGIQSTTYYRYIASGQLTGMLVGVRGVAEYDAMLHPDEPERRLSAGTKRIVPQAFGHSVIILAIALGNIGYFASRMKGKNHDS